MIEKNNSKTLEQLYYYMALTRAFDQKAINLQRTGRLGTFPSSYGQEGLFVSAGLAIEKEDSYCPYYRDQGALIARNANITRLLCYWGGFEIGNDLLSDRFDLPINVPIASQTTHATGIAYAIKYRNEQRIALCSIGDGGTSKGEFYESLNMSAVHKLPVLFVINNNCYAISTPISQQSATLDLSKKGLAFDIPSINVDGQNAIEVYNKIQEMREHCLKRGPAIIVAKTYRLHDHTTADDAKRYLSENYISDGENNDPIARIQALISEDYITKADKKIKDVINYSVDQYLAMTDTSSPFEYTFQKMPACLKHQKTICEAYND